MKHVRENISVNLKAIRQATPGRVGRALSAEGGIEMKEMKRITPVDKGDLQRSGAVGEPEIKGTSISVTLSFGGGDYPHDQIVPIVVHENLEAFHTPPGQAKYMESVFNASAPYMGRRLAKRLHFDTGDK